jgi:hypothetical protein
MLNKTNSGNYVILEMHCFRSYEEFSCINNSLHWYNENEDSEEAIIEQIAVKHQKTSDNHETNDDNRSECEWVTNQDAMKFIGLWLSLTQEGNEGNPISALETYTDFVQWQSIKNTAAYTQSIPLSSLTTEKYMSV